MPSYDEHMVVGFMFDKELRNVLLLWKTHPDWQAGRLNGVGGHREERDTGTNETMRREFREETGVDTEWDAWKPVATLRGQFWRVWTLCAVAPLEVLQAAVRNTRDKDERCEIVAVDRVSAHNTIGNVRWLVPLAIDRLKNPEAPKSVLVKYTDDE
jgi:8-oxo-dGTP pyrophosphatase MutT (NUDIX family)